EGEGGWGGLRGRVGSGMEETADEFTRGLTTSPGLLRNVTRHRAIPGPALQLRRVVLRSGLRWQAVVGAQHQADTVGRVAEDEALGLDDRCLDGASVQGEDPGLQEQPDPDGGGREPPLAHPPMGVAVLGFEGADAVLKGGGSGGRRAHGRRLLAGMEPAYQPWRPVRKHAAFFRTAVALLR